MSHRYFTQDIAGGSARLAREDAAHLVRVLRARPGQRLTLCDGAGNDYEAEIVAATPERVELSILSRRTCAAEPAVQVTVFAGMAKGERMDYAIQKSVELGAVAVVPFFSQNCVVKPKSGEERLRRFQRIAAEAAKPAGRGILPGVHSPVPFAQVLPLACGHERALFLYEGGGRSLRRALAGLATRATLAVITGPEGGFTPEEAAQAAQAGCIPVGLGPRILRCETAPVAVLSAIMSFTGNLE
jgi:16S rRNA (uracil1498-N3)-methyltransferase